ncbi:MAG: methylmalonyl-CoA epimerase [Candidatus Riflebacteria bacterium]|nr:methylmalonyl-CoA epimerase [Candidatus Riflebacteria bacterium]
MLRKIDHIAIAVKSLDESLTFFRDRLGLSVEKIVEVPSEGVRVAFLPIGDTEIELLEPLAPDSPVAKFIEKKGPGLHHVAFDVADVAGELERLAGQGVSTLDARPRKGAVADVGFVHPRASGGVLVELSQRKKP